MFRRAVMSCRRPGREVMFSLLSSRIASWSNAVAQSLASRLARWSHVTSRLKMLLHRIMDNNQAGGSNLDYLKASVSFYMSHLEYSA